MDCYNGYNQVKMVKENKDKMAFILNGVYMHVTLCLLGYVIFCYFPKSSNKIV
jgi:hypothetical protein